jgi:osmotically-inducible protein OsmY
VTPVQSRITIYADRATESQLITRDVVDEIARDPQISGYVGVETRHNDVTLSGLVTTPGQAERAARDARRVDGVRNVSNNVRARVGG